ncbi:MAG: serine hydrolase domain-containing protein [Parvularculaceae bacterium]
MRFRFVAAALLTAIAFIAQANAAGPDVQRARKALADELIARQNDAPGTSGAVLSPTSGLIIFQTGVADRRTEEPVNGDTRFFSGSIGKTVTAAVAAKLVSDGAIALDDPIGKYLSDRPWFKDLKNADKITVRMLLNHSAGIPSYLDSTRFFLMQRAHRKNGYTPDKLVSYVAKLPPAGEPGAHFAYSDTHYILAGMIIEKATGRSFYDLADEIVIKPMKLAHTTPLRGRRHDDLANGYRRIGPLARIGGVAGSTQRKGALTFNPDYEWAGGGYVTTPADLASFYSQLFSSEEFAGIREIMTAPRNLNPVSEGLNYGLGVYVNMRRPPGLVFAHGGDFMGYRSFVLYDDNTGAAIAVQANAKRYEPGDAAFAILNGVSSAD